MIPESAPFLELFRVWPDGTVQAVGDGEPYEWMSDDYLVVEAFDEEAALKAAEERTNRLSWKSTLAALETEPQPRAGRPAGVPASEEREDTPAAPERGFIPVEDVIRTLEAALPLLDAAAAGQRVCSAAGERAREWRRWLRFLRSAA